ncbi:MAG: hypothetical protein LBV68_06115 [Spirochaetaceae bacterium]|nr:hypothetical protein [Spirochaetaceae bacterium]
MKIQALVALICIVVYAVSAVYAGVHVYNEYERHSELAEQEYSDLKDFASSAGVLGFSSSAFQNDIEDAVRTSKTLMAVIISGPKNYTFVVEKTPDLVNRNGRYPYFKNSVSLLKKLEPAPLYVEGFSNVGISALATIMDFNDLILILRPPFLGILIALLVSFSLLITEVGFAKNKKTAGNKNEDEDEKEDTEELDFYSGNNEESPDWPVESADFEQMYDEEETELQPLIADMHQVPDIRQEEETELQLLTPDIPQEEPEEIPVGEKESAPAVPDFYEDDPFETPEPPPDFAGSLSLMLENDEELCLLSLNWSNPDVAVSGGVEAISEYFKEARIFEKPDSQGLYAIIPDMNIDEAFDRTKELYRVISTNPQGIFIGLSSKAGRLINASRLINETETALIKAHETKTHPIVAFKADPEKYKLFLESHR